MARIRTIKPEFWKSEELSALPEATHLLAAALLNYADDEGYFNANPKLIQAETSPLREPSVTVPASLLELSSVGYLKLGIGADGKAYGQIVNFCKHQWLSHPKPSKIKAVGITWEPSGKLPDDSGLNRDQGTGNGSGNREQGEPVAFATAPSAEQALLKPGKRRIGTKLPDAWMPDPSDLDYAYQRDFGDAQIADIAENFRTYWTAGAGRNKTHADWSRAWQMWIRREKPIGAADAGTSRKQAPLEAMYAGFAKAAAER